MNREEFLVKDRARQAKQRADQKTRRIVWRVAFRREQGDALEKAKALLKMENLKPTPRYFLCKILNNKRGPRPDDITHINSLWAKYKV